MQTYKHIYMYNYAADLSSASAKAKGSDSGHHLINRLEEQENSYMPAKLLSAFSGGSGGCNGPISGPPTSGGDESLAVMPWKGAIREPSNWKEEGLGLDGDGDGDGSSEPGATCEASLEMKFVYGYRGWDCRNNIGFAGNRSLVIYHIAAVGIVYNSQTHTQIHNTEHDDDIISLAIHPKGHMVASGEVGKKPKIVLWDANTGVTVRVIHFHSRGVSNIVFSKCGDLVVSAGMDNDRTIAVHNAHTGALVGKGKAGRGVEVLTLNVGNDGKFVSGGKGHIKFWDLPSTNAAGGELQCKGGLYNNKTIKCRTVVSSTFLMSDCVTGMSDGTLVLWKDRSAAKFVKAHKGAVMAMCELPEKGSIGGTQDAGPRIISGGRDGHVHIWSYKLQKVWSLDLSSPDTTPTSANPHVRAVSTYGNRLLIGTKGSELYVNTRIWEYVNM